MFWWIYELVFFAGLLLASPYYLWRMRRRGGYARNFCERFGRYSPDAEAAIRALGRPVWIHAVSVGEVQLALPLIEQLRRSEPGLPILLSTTTSTGYALAKEKEGAGLAVVYYPMDSRFFFRRIHELADPRALLLIEAELWPNHLRYAASRGVRLALINARMSDRSFARYHGFKFLFREAIGSFDLITLQCEADRERLLSLGAKPGALSLIGSLKYGAVRSVDETRRARLLEDLAFLKGRPVLVAASTHAGEEELLLDAFGSLRGRHPKLALVLAPRHVERKSGIVEMLERRQTDFVCRSSPGRGADVVLLDTTGDLRYVYELASVVFIGKSLRGRGGQNLMEPAWYGKPVVFGPHMENFRPIVQDFLAAEAAVQVAGDGELIPALHHILNGAGSPLGARARALMQSREHVLEETVGRVAALLNER